MNPQPLPVSTPGLALSDIYYALFRHKWKILASVAAGAVGALAIYRYDPAPYQSEAKLYVRYVLADKAIGPAASDAAAKSPDQRGETIMNSETEILTSVDVARQVAEAVGPDKILARAGGGKDASRATALIKSNLLVTVPPASSVMHVVFKHPDPDIVQPVLREVIDRYLKLHVETHTANGMVGDFLTQETDQLRARLAQTEEQLRQATSKAGVISVDDAKRTYSAQMAAIRQETFGAEAELAEKASALQEMQKRLPAMATPADGATPVPVEALAAYRDGATRLGVLRKMEQDLLAQFTPANPRVVEVRSQLAATETAQHDWETRYPRLVQLTAATERNPSAESVAAMTLATQIVALKAKITVLNGQTEALRNEARRIEQMEGTIVELQRKRELDEANYRYYSTSLEQERINETLGNGHVSNIIQIQSPSPPFSERSKTNRTVATVFVAALAAGLAWAFLIELYLDRSLKRPIDVERAIPAPLLLSIPALRPKQLRAAAGVLLGDGTEANLGSAERPLLPYHETLRDRLITYFESINLTHKPKLVAVTALGGKAGVTTTAAGLARSLSETGEGNVLLVDMTVGHGIARQFANGRATCALDDVLDAPRADAHVEENLYVVTENSNSDRLSRNLPQRFTKLVPKLKASDFGYIIFDMPPVNQISITPRLAGFMDIVLLVVESEKTDRDLVQRAAALLASSRAHVGVVLNKMRYYVPNRLDQEALAN